MWVVLAGLLIAALAGLGLAGAGLLRPHPLSVVSNGWIAFSTQPGFPEAMHECCGSGGDIYLVREGVEPKADRQSRVSQYLERVPRVLTATV